MNFQEVQYYGGGVDRWELYVVVRDTLVLVTFVIFFVKKPNTHMSGSII